MSASVERSRRESQPSFLISDEENRKLFRLIGPRCQSMATAVAQVLSADPPNRTKWSKKHIGLLCFIKDHSKRSYFFRVYCLEREAIVWEQELYLNFEYSAPRPYFHTFEGDASRIGLSFADVDEASNFLTAVNEHLRARAEKANRRRTQQRRSVHTISRTSLNAATEKEQLSQTSRNETPKKKQSIEEPEESKRPIANKFYTLGRKKAKDKHKKIKKIDIGEPMNFEHVSHAGLDPNQGFSLVNVDPQLLKFFQTAGISDKHLNNSETRQFIFDFIDKHGGKEAVIREAEQPAEVAHHHGAPTKRHAPATPQQIKAPSVKPPSPPDAHRETNPASNIPPPPPMMDITPPSSAPPPPPPPLPVPESKRSTAQEAHPLPASPPLQTDPRNELMNAIRDGPKLKPVEETRRPSYSDPKSDLLEQIRAGKELKHVERHEESVPKEITPEGIAGALARALQERSRVIHSDSDRSDHEHEDEWDDWEE